MCVMYVCNMMYYYGCTNTINTEFKCKTTTHTSKMVMGAKGCIFSLFMGLQGISFRLINTKLEQISE